jgi:hypothetical protein
MIRPTRRELLGFIGGGVVGAALSPSPWKLLDDAAIWTQNWSLTPRLPRGPLTVTRGHCSLCPAACGVGVRCVGPEPCGVTPVAGHPNSQGALCSLGLAGYQLRHHRDRLVQSLLAAPDGPTPISPAELIGFVARDLDLALAAGGAAAVAVLDTRPGRTDSLSLRAFLASLGPEAAYLTAGGERGPFDRFARSIGLGDPDLDRALVPDLGRARTIVGFGANLLEGYGSMGWVSRHLRTPPAVRPTLIQIDSRPSRTALLADRWLRIRPGTEGAAALGIGRAILDEPRLGTPPGRDPSALAAALGALAAYRSLTVEQAAWIAGVAAADLRDLARLLVDGGPAVTVPGVDPAAGPLPVAAETAILGLCAITGNLGVEGGLVLRPAAPLPESLAVRGLPAATAIEQVPDGSLRLLLVDASAGAGLRAMARAACKVHPTDGRLVLLGPFAPAVLPARSLAIPTPLWLEAHEDVETPLDAPTARLALAARAGERRTGTMTPANLVLALGRARGTEILDGAEPGDDCFSRLLSERARAIHGASRGTVAGPESGDPRPVADLERPEEIVTALERGAVWIDDAPAPGEPLAARLDAGAIAALERAREADGGGSTAQTGLLAMPHGSRVASDRLALPLHLAKLSRENGVVPDRDTATIHPATARRLGLGPGATAALDLPGGRRPVRVAVDARIDEEVVDLAVAPTPGAFGDTEREPARPSFTARVVVAQLAVA